MSLDVHAAVATIKVRTSLGGCDGSCEVVVYWLGVANKRQDYKQALERLGSDLNVVGLIPRGDTRFDSPNALMDDLVALIDKNRSAIEGRLDAMEAGRPLVLVIVSRTRLDVSMIASPVTIPAWMPRVGGRQIVLDVVDLEAVADGTLADPASCVQNVREGLHDLEGAVISWVQDKVHTRNPRERVLEGILALRAGEFDGFLTRAAHEYDSVTNPMEYRLSLKSGADNTFLSRLLRAYVATQPQRLPQLTQQVARALCMQAPRRLTEPWLGVMFRPQGGSEAPEVRLARCLLVSVYFGHHIALGAAHAADYGRFSLQLLRANGEATAQAIRACADELWVATP